MARKCKEGVNKLLNLLKLFKELGKALAGLSSAYSVLKHLIPEPLEEENIYLFFIFYFIKKILLRLFASKQSPAGKSLE